MKTILFLGNSFAGILADVRRTFPNMRDDEIIVVCRDAERLPAPEEFSVVPVSAFVVDERVSYTVIGNGGTTRQQVHVLRALVEADAAFMVYEIERGGACTLLWQRDARPQ